MDGGLIILLLIIVPPIILFCVLMYPYYSALDYFVSLEEQGMKAREEQEKMEKEKREALNNQGE